MKFLLTCLLALLPQAADEKATVYFYRLEEVSRFQGNKPKVHVNDKLALLLPESEFVGVRLAPGKYVARMSGRRTETLLDLKPGSVTFVRVERVGDGWSGMRDALHITEREQALFQMREMRPLEAKNVKGKELEIVTTKPAP